MELGSQRIDVQQTRESVTNNSAVNGFTGTVGNTPLGARYGKAEFQKPGGSGRIKPGGTVVEGAASNTGIGLTHVCRPRGYECVIFMPNIQIDLLRMLGAEVYPVPAVPYENPLNYNHQANYAKKLENVIWTDQFQNTVNAYTHYISTGPEMWEQSMDEIDGFYLKERSNSRTQIWLVDPPGNVLYECVTSGGNIERSRSSVTERISQGRVTSNFGTFVTDLTGALHIPDEKAISMLHQLLDTEDLYIGAPSALNIVATVELAQKLGNGSKVVTILFDGAYRYQSHLFSKK
ncbi:tryptophan synthase beta subunit-like PLP-dependent enzyme [Suillus subaureus]|uniref:Cysteine synthase 1 n=1 Tax=Suillus subaureus TaxID=48587 RepID=A0A9P7E1A1_9AGAM|nr:tryptophan synthase beta subunit-like PLP-dependent enzyme [Suillus subaureus]KAG1808216.1 tryptophan synthase beta subunit-like PLP-dependent enzyme [Suillus subaureus]